MIFSVSAVVLFGLLVAVLVRWAGLKTWHAIVCLLFGFFLASSPLAPLIREAVRHLVGVFAGR